MITCTYGCVSSEIVKCILLKWLLPPYEVRVMMQVVGAQRHLLLSGNTLYYIIVFVSYSIVSCSLV